VKHVTLVTGGTRSGKSTHALELALSFPKRVFVATAIAFDQEMQERIAKHREERGQTFQTIEEPINLAEALQTVPANTDVVLIDCLTIWASNLLFRCGEDKDWFPQIDNLLDALSDPPCHVILVTNEVGMGIVPESALGRRFRDLAGSINQKVARIATHVVFMVSGIPMTIKPQSGEASC